MQDACGVANPTGIHRHVDDLLLHRRRLPSITIVQQEGTPGTALLAAPVPLLSLTSLAMADDIGPLTVGTGQELENHDATRSRWECLTSETLIEDSTSTPLRHLWTGHVGGPSGDGQGDRHTAKPRLVGVQTRTPGSETVSERGLSVDGHLGEQTCSLTRRNSP